ncbi:MAG TPA: TIGR01777 family oxidoreductase [Kofleriaceae bacterium]|nr:TIGR01777 family oxidoreductase [Kofleriaceae bacterium]
MSDDASARPGRVVVTGATGLVGRPLVKALVGAGHAVTALVRDAARARTALGDGVDVVAADLENPGAWQASLAGAAAIVHLAGEPIGGRRWNARQKQLIRDSRVESTRVIVEHLARLDAGARPRALVSASGIDYYGAADPELDDDLPVDERAPRGDSYLARVCGAWEAEAAAAERLGVRVARLRTGVVIAPGGALARMTTPFKLFVGGRVGSGAQWFSWIHLDDAVAAYVAAVDDARYTGPINLVAPGSARNRDLAHALGAALHRPSWLPVPAFALRVAVGELADYLLTGRRAVPAALERLGFAFAHPTLDEAVTSAVRER